MNKCGRFYPILTFALTAGSTTLLVHPLPFIVTDKPIRTTFRVAAKCFSAFRPAVCDVGTPSCSFFHYEVESPYWLLMIDQSNLLRLIRIQVNEDKNTLARGRGLARLNAPPRVREAASF